MVRVASSLLFAVLLTGCMCGGDRLVVANGGTLEATLVGADPTAVRFVVTVSNAEGRAQVPAVTITSLPVSGSLDQLPPGDFTVEAWVLDGQGTRLPQGWSGKATIVARQTTEVIIDLTPAPPQPPDPCATVWEGSSSAPVCALCTAGVVSVPEDDGACGFIDCSGLDGYQVRGDNTATGQARCIHTTHLPLVDHRCESQGKCRAANGAGCTTSKEEEVARATLCHTMTGCEQGTPSLVTVADGTPCGAHDVCQQGVCTPVIPDNTGCSDGTREGFTNRSAYPGLASCAGGWSVPGVTRANLAPTCNRVNGNSSANPSGAGCSAADLCSEGWHVCRGSAEVAQHATSCADSVPAGTPDKQLFFAVAQASQTNSICDSSGDNDVFGCGNLGVQLTAGKSCGVLNRVLASTQPGSCGYNEAEPGLGPWQCLGGSDSHLHEGALVTKQGCPHNSCTWNGQPVGNADRGGVLCCVD